LRRMACFCRRADAAKTGALKQVLSTAHCRGAGQRGIIRSQEASWLAITARRKHREGGEYEFESSPYHREFYAGLPRGDFLPDAVVPEGYTCFDIATAIEEVAAGQARRLS